ncbi:MAG: hypothetical protein RR856_11205, partial [Acinetobacter sp.]
LPCGLVYWVLLRSKNVQFTVFKLLIVPRVIDYMVGFRNWLRHWNIIELNQLLIRFVQQSLLEV